MGSAPERHAQKQSTHGRNGKRDDNADARRNGYFNWPQVMVGRILDTIQRDSYQDNGWKCEPNDKCDWNHACAREPRQGDRSPG